MIEHIEKKCRSLTDDQRQQLAVAMDDIVFMLPEDVSAVFDQYGESEMLKGLKEKELHQSPPNCPAALLDFSHCTNTTPPHTHTCTHSLLCLVLHVCSLNTCISTRTVSTTGRKFCFIALRFWLLTAHKGPDDPEGTKIFKVTNNKEGHPQKKIVTAVYE